VRPEVTIVIPTKDRWETVRGTALAASSRQEDVELEIVVVDDGSRDEAPPEIALADPRVRILVRDNPQGVGAARNAGIEAATAPWVAFLDDDDLWSPRKLRLQVDAALAAGAGFAYGGAIWVGDALRPLHGHEPPDPALLATELLRWNTMWGGSSNVLARTELLRVLGGFDESLHQLADWDLWLRLARASPAARVDQVLVALVVHQQSMLLTDQRDVFLELDCLDAKHRQAREAAGVELDRARFARWVGAGHARAGRRGDAARAYVRGTRAPGNVARAAVALLGRAPLSTLSSLRANLPGALEAGHRTATRPDWLDLYR